MSWIWQRHTWSDSITPTFHRPKGDVRFSDRTPSTPAFLFVSRLTRSAMPCLPPTRFLFGRVFRQSSQGPEYPAAGSQLDYVGLRKDLGNP